MKTFSRLFITVASVVLLAYGASAQSYNTAIGGRLGGQTSGLTIRQFTNSNTALEGIVSFGNKSFLITGLFEKFVSIGNSPGFSWFYGIGGHVGFFGPDSYYNNYKGRIYDRNTTVVGLDGILGLDYKIRNAPINIGIDVKPFVDFDNGANFIGDGAINLRFVF